MFIQSVALNCLALLIMHRIFTTLSSSLSCKTQSTRILVAIVHFCVSVLMSAISAVNSSSHFRKYKIVTNCGVEWRTGHCPAGCQCRLHSEPCRHREPVLTQPYSEVSCTVLYTTILANPYFLLSYAVLYYAVLCCSLLHQSWATLKYPSPNRPLHLNSLHCSTVHQAYCTTLQYRKYCVTMGSPGSPARLLWGAGMFKNCNHTLL